MKMLSCLVLLMIVTGCTPRVGNGGGTAPAWPVQSYPLGCTGSTLPFEPLCVDTLIDDGFKYRGEFEACRQSLQAYEDAINTFIRCRGGELKKLFGKLAVQARDTYNCYVDFFSTRDGGDPTSLCTLVERPTFHAHYEADGLEYDFGIPDCVAMSSPAFAKPDHINDLDTCKESIEAFSGEGFGYGSYSIDSTPAQKQYDNYMSNLRREAESKLDDAVRQFNCKARGERICF